MKNEVIIKEEKWVWPAADKGSWEGQNRSKDLVNQIKPYLKGNDIMVQAGGNCGFILSTFIDLFDTIYTFEPEPVNFYCLNMNVTDKKVIKMQTCLGFEKNTVSMEHIPSMNIGGCHVSGPGRTPTITIDSLNLPACDLIQFDLEGYELNALYGSVETINKYKPVLCVEFCEPWLKRYGDNSEKLLNYIQNSLGYKLVNTYNADKIFVPN